MYQLLIFRPSQVQESKHCLKASVKLGKYMGTCTCTHSAHIPFEVTLLGIFFRNVYPTNNDAPVYFLLNNIKVLMELCTAAKIFFFKPGYAVCLFQCICKIKEEENVNVKFSLWHHDMKRAQNLLLYCAVWLTIGAWAVRARLGEIHLFSGRNFNPPFLLSFFLRHQKLYCVLIWLLLSTLGNRTITSAHAAPNECPTKTPFKQIDLSIRLSDFYLS